MAMRLCYVIANRSGSGLYRVKIPARHLEKILDVSVIEKIDTVALAVNDVFVIQYTVNEEYPNLISEWRKKGRTFIFELDDNLWGIMEGNAARPYWSPERISMAEQIIRHCDAVTVSTQPLADIVSRHNKNVHVVPNYVEYPTAIRQRRDTPEVRIGYCASMSHIPDMDVEIVEALRKIKERYGYRVEFIFIDWIKRPLAGKATLFPPVMPADYLNFIHRLDLDIGLIPCVMTQFNECRSNLKYLEYSITNAASIASPVYPYITTIEDGKGIVLRDNSQSQWYEAISMLIEDDALRKKMAAEAYNHIVDNYLMERNAPAIARTYSSIRDQALC